MYELSNKIGEAADEMEKAIENGTSLEETSRLMQEARILAHAMAEQAKQERYLRLLNGLSETQRPN